ncbi:MAG: hypothetical protein ABWX67_04850 [Allosphingosinicella sp.]
MNVRVAFDTHAFIKRLEAGGLSVAHAEALADALGDIVLQSIATKSDLREVEVSLRAEIKNLGVTLRAEMNALELRMASRMGVMIAASTTMTIAVLGALKIFS